LFWFIFGIYGSLFATTWFVFANQTQISISKSNTPVNTQRESFQEKLIQDFKNSPFFQNQHFSSQEANFWQKRANKSILTKQKLLFYYFQNSQVVADPFIVVAFIFSPFGIKHQNGINCGPWTPLPHQNLQ
jgi:hypothetical protein